MTAQSIAVYKTIVCPKRCCSLIPPGYTFSLIKGTSAHQYEVWLLVLLLCPPPHWIMYICTMQQRLQEQLPPLPKYFKLFNCSVKLMVHPSTGKANAGM